MEIPSLPREKTNKSRQELGINSAWPYITGGSGSLTPYILTLIFFSIFHFGLCELPYAIKTALQINGK